MISTVRTLPVPSAVAWCSCFARTTKTSSNLPKFAAGFTLMLRNKPESVPETFATRPRGKPLGKIWSPPLVSNVSPGVTCSSLITRSSMTSPFAVPRSTPCRRDFSAMAPTPLL